MTWNRSVRKSLARLENFVFNKSNIYINTRMHIVWLHRLVLRPPITLGPIVSQKKKNFLDLSYDINNLSKHYYVLLSLKAIGTTTFKWWSFSLYHQVNHSGNMNHFPKIIFFFLQTVCLHCDIFKPNELKYLVSHKLWKLYSYTMKEPQSAGNTTSGGILVCICYKRDIAEKTVNMLWLHCNAEYFCEAAVHPCIGNKIKTIQLQFF